MLRNVPSFSHTILFLMFVYMIKQMEDKTLMFMLFQNSFSFKHIQEVLNNVNFILEQEPLSFSFKHIQEPLSFSFKHIQAGIYSTNINSIKMTP